MDFDLTTGGWMLLGLSLAMAFAFEMVNGCHDTANAVATVIYTNSLKPTTAVVWAGIWNFIGVLYATATGLAVAFSIVHLLPVDLVVSLGQTAGILMVLSMLASAIFWNAGTWYLGIPASSSHTLIGAILGAGLGGALLRGQPWAEGVNWGKVSSTFQALLVSPLIGFAGAALLLLACKAFARDPRLYQPPVGTEPPPPWIRRVLILTCTGVSFAHGSNDGQKGIGLIMLILVGMLPGAYALNPSFGAEDIRNVTAVVDRARGFFQAEQQKPRVMTGQLGAGVAPLRDGGPEAEWADVHAAGTPVTPDAPSILAHLALVRGLVADRSSFKEIKPQERFKVRTEILRLRQAMRDYAKLHQSELSADERRTLAGMTPSVYRITEFAPIWVSIGVAFALGIGTMIGWRRIVVTVAEKIGKTHLTYAQGMSAEIIAMATVFGADLIGLPVSTTHVLSSGIAGTMVANRSGLQGKTLRNIALAWVLTLPVTMALSALLFMGLSAVFLG